MVRLTFSAGIGANSHGDGWSRSAALRAPLAPEPAPIIGSSLSLVVYFIETVPRTAGTVAAARESGSEQWRVIGLLRCGFVSIIPNLNQNTITCSHKTFPLSGAETGRFSKSYQCHFGIRDGWSSDPGSSHQWGPRQLLGRNDEILQPGLLT